MGVAPRLYLNGPALYNRLYSVAVQTKGSQFGLQWGNEAGAQTALKVSFEIERNLGGVNKGKIVLYNLSIASRARLQVGAAMRLRAGYVGAVGVLFLGTIAKVEHARSGPDIISSCELVDAEPYVAFTVFDRAYGKNTHLAVILNDVANAMNVSFKNQVSSIKRGIALGISDHTYAQGFVAHGPCKHTLTKLCRPRGLEWTVQNGALNIIPKAAGDGRTAHTLSSTTGLVGVPNRDAKQATFECLLNPAIVPGCIVRLVTLDPRVDGFYKVRTAKYAGDSHDAPWTIHAEAVPIPGAVIGYPVAQGQTYQGAVLS